MSKNLPPHYLAFRKNYPEVSRAYEELGKSLREAGPLDAKVICLVKLATAVGARTEGAVHSHVRRALEAGCSTEEIRQSIILSLTTIGFPNMMAALRWADDILHDQGPAE
jgi:4-carboxymuconolactone decarboxylase